MAREGLMITLKALPGLTVDTDGKKLLSQPFRFQCPPMDEFKFTRQYTFGNYDTIYDGQFTRQGSRQLRVWTFDTLAMVLGANADNLKQWEPRWVPFPNFDGTRTVDEEVLSGHKDRTKKSRKITVNMPSTPEWYADQISNLFYAGCPFRFSAAMVQTLSNFNESAASVTPILQSYAVLLQYDEGYKQGEGDAIYFEGMSFSEWRDPTLVQDGLGKPKGSTNLPTTVSLNPDRPTCVLDNGQGLGTTLNPLTLAMLAKVFYGEPGDWVTIARTNKLTGGGANTPVTQLNGINWPKNKNIDQNKWPKLKIPARVNKKQQTSRYSASEPVGS